MRTKYSIINQTEIYFSGQASKLSRHEVCQSALMLAYISCSCSVCAKLSGRTMSPSSAIPSKPARSSCYSHHTAFHHVEPTHALKITAIACGPMEIQTAVLSCPNSFQPNLSNSTLQQKTNVMIITERQTETECE